MIALLLIYIKNYDIIYIIRIKRGGTMHLVKCVYCGVSFDRDKVPMVQVSARRYAHEECHTNQENGKTKEQKDLEELEKYIMHLFKETCISARIRKQISQMRQQYDYSYSGILKSLVYFFEVKGNSIEKANNGIGIVPFVYKDAYTYYYALFCAQQKNEDKDIHSFAYEVHEIIIDSPQRKPRKRNRFTFLDDTEESTDGE